MLKNSDLGALALGAVVVFLVVRNAMGAREKAELRKSVVVDYRKDPFSVFASDAAGRSIMP